MTIYLPGAMLAAGISLYHFYEFHRVKESKQIERRERLNGCRQQYLHLLIEANRKMRGTAEDPPASEPNEGTSGSSNLP